MKQFFLKLFTWWNSETFGTQLWTWRFGELVGTDEQGNRYYRTAGRKIDPTLGFERRWVIYNGLAGSRTASGLMPPAGRIVQQSRLLQPIGRGMGAACFWPFGVSVAESVSYTH